MLHISLEEIQNLVSKTNFTQVFRSKSYETNIESNIGLGIQENKNRSVIGSTSLKTNRWIFYNHGMLRAHVP